MSLDGLCTNSTYLQIHQEFICFDLTHILITTGALSVIAQRDRQQNGVIILSDPIYHDDDGAPTLQELVANLTIYLALWEVDRGST